MPDDRQSQLLIAAGDCFKDGQSPFNQAWLSDNNVSFDECFWLGDTIGSACHFFAKIGTTERIGYVLAGLAEDDSLTEFILSRINYARWLKAAGSIGPDPIPEGG